LHEGERDPVDAEAQPKLKIGAVLRGQRRHVEHRAGQIDPFAVRDRPAVDHLCLNVVVADSGDVRAHAAIVDKQVLARRDRRENLIVRQGNRGLLAFSA
jgi:hypothetical protein